MKNIIEEAMAVFMKELDNILVVRNDAYNKALNAMHRGDVVNYNKWCEKVKECNSRQIELSNELNEIEAVYAAI